VTADAVHLSSPLSFSIDVTFQQYRLFAARHLSLKSDAAPAPAYRHFANNFIEFPVFRSGKRLYYIFALIDDSPLPLREFEYTLRLYIENRAMTI
jgi:hypothetical protein